MVETDQPQEAGRHQQFGFEREVAAGEIDDNRRRHRQSPLDALPVKASGLGHHGVGRKRADGLQGAQRRAVEGCLGDRALFVGTRVIDRGANADHDRNGGDRECHRDVAVYKAKETLNHNPPSERYDLFCSMILYYRRIDDGLNRDYT